MVSVLICRLRALPVPRLVSTTLTNIAPEGSVPTPPIEPAMRGTPTATVTVEVAVPTLPLASLKLNVTVVVPIGKSVALVAASPPTCGGSCVGAGETVEVAVAPARNTASAGEAPLVAPVACVAGMEMAAGGVTAGRVVAGETTSLRVAEVLAVLETSPLYTAVME